MKPWLVESWCTPPKDDANYVAAMEDILWLLHQPRDPARPLLCIDEVPIQFHGEVAPELPARRGSPAKRDYEYVRNGSGSVFMVFAPLEGKRMTYVAPGATRTGTDYAELLRIVAEQWMPGVASFTVIQDNLSTHTKGSLYRAFPAPDALSLARKFDFHFTPKHASWLNPAESEISVLVRQCLSRRVPDELALRAEVKAWEARRNEIAAKANWQFTNDDARIKLASLYPQFD